MRHSTLVPADLLRNVVAAEPARPLVTFYDDATGERVEFSAKTFDNWVAKTANLLVDGLDAEPGETATLALPPHWQTAVWLFACWSAGVTAEVVAEEPMAAVRLAGRETVGLSLHALGAPLQMCPPGVVDYALEVRSYGDRFAPHAPIDPDAPALITDTGGVTKTTLSGTELVRQGTQAATDWGLDARSRVLVDMRFTTLSGLLAGLIAPIAAGGSVIICRNLDKVLLERRISVEHVTAVAGKTSSGSVHRLA
jgi:uncharacterized protein (TIGR03089 family)